MALVLVKKSEIVPNTKYTYTLLNNNQDVEKTYARPRLM